MKPKGKIRGVKTPKLSNIKGDNRRQDYLAIRHTSSRVKSADNVKQFYDDMVASDPTLKSFTDSVKKEGHELYLVGGSVRDILLGKKPKDMDFVTDAHPDKISKMIKDIGAKSVDVGKDFGINVLVGKKDNYDIATFRQDEYGDADAHRPEGVNYVDSIDKDLSRRDFTINAMAFDVINNKMVDNFGGMNDLKNGKIRSVGDATQRFKEDPLRILRAFRFSSKLGFEIDKGVMDAIPQFVKDPKTNKLSRERVLGEVEKMMMTDNPEVGLKAMFDTGMNEITMKNNKNKLVGLFPELSHLKDLGQNPAYHEHDALNHTLNVVKNAPKNIDVRYAALLHDGGKGQSHIRTFKENGVPQDIHHEKASSDMTKEVLKRFEFNQKRIKDINFMVENHMKTLHKPKPKYMNRYLNDLKGSYNNKADFKNAISNLMDLRIADVSAGIKLEGGVDMMKSKKQALLKHLDETAMYPTDLKISGNDISAILGVKGKEIGKVLQEYVQRVQTGSVKNDRESLIDALEKKKIRKDKKVSESYMKFTFKQKDWNPDFNALDIKDMRYQVCKMLGCVYKDDEIQTLHDFKDGNNAITINALNSNNFKVLESLQSSKKTPELFVQNMDSVINKLKANNEFFVYKLVSDDEFDLKDDNIKNVHFKCCGYFMADLNGIKLKEKNEPSVLLKIRVPENTNYAVIENDNIQGTNIILPRNCVFKITGNEYDILYNNAVNIISAELINIT